MEGWETALAVAIVLLIVVNVVAALWAGRRMRGLTVVLLDLEQWLRHREHASEPGDLATGPEIVPTRRPDRRMLGFAAAALVATGAAIGVGAWALSSSTSERVPATRAILLRAEGTRARSSSPAGSVVLLLSDSRKASLLLSGLGRGRLYRASLAVGGNRRTLARFSGARSVVPLPGTLPRGAVVTVTRVGATKPLYVSRPLR